MPRYKQHELALAFARGELARAIKEVPLGSNTGERVRWYQSHTWLSGTRWPWCVAFVQTCWTEGARRKLPYPTAGAHDFAKWARRHGWAVPASKAVPGDGVVFNIGSGHMAVLESILDDAVTTIDGNVSHRVKRCTRPLALVENFVHVPEDAAADPPPPKPPVFEVVTSSSGHAKLVYVSGPRAIARKLPELLNRFGGITIRRRRRAPGGRAADSDAKRGR